MSKNEIGVCAVCGELKKMSFEHFPPKCSGNNVPVKIQDYRHLFPFEDNPNLDGKSSTLNKGFGGYRLCEKCNKDTGSWYAEEYCYVANKMSIILSEERKKNLSDNYIIPLKPLNFIKQVMTMFLYADRALGAIRMIVKETDFILNKETTLISDNVKIFMGVVPYKDYKSIGLSIIGDFSENIITTKAYLSCYPFTFSLFTDEPIDVEAMTDITYFKNFKYNENADIEFILYKKFVRTYKEAVDIVVEFWLKNTFRVFHTYIIPDDINEFLNSEIIKALTEEEIFKVLYLKKHGFNNNSMQLFKSKLHDILMQFEDKNYIENECYVYNNNPNRILEIVCKEAKINSIFLPKKANTCIGNDHKVRLQDDRGDTHLI